jgi:hypothetical protein
MKELQKKNKKSAHHLLEWPLLLGKRRIVPEWKPRAYPQIASRFGTRAKGQPYLWIDSKPTPIDY